MEYPIDSNGNRLYLSEIHNNKPTKMEENKIPTAAEFINDSIPEEFSGMLYSKICEKMREFAKMHVKKQQEEIISKVTENGNIRTDLIDFIPKCYPLENIK